MQVRQRDGQGGYTVPSFSRLVFTKPDFLFIYLFKHRGSVYSGPALCILTWKIQYIPGHAYKTWITMLFCTLAFFLAASNARILCSPQEHNYF